MPADRPRLSRSAAPRPKTGIVHLGLGAFFRAHGAVYVQEAMERLDGDRGGDWGIIGVSLQSPAVRDLLAPQDYVYTALELGPEGEKPRQVESVIGMLVAPEDPEAVLSAMADPAIRIVSLTVTEKGYCHEPSTGRLDRAHPGILHDISNPLPRTAPGFLVRALERRKQAGTPPFTVLTCDNLPENGKVVRGVVSELAAEIDQGLAGWISEHVRFPSTMVDRIVPATSQADIERLAGRSGILDLAPVMHEPFRQWVIEDDFGAGGRPDFSGTGVQLVEDVTPFEHMKLRMLNGAHSSLAYLGYLAGHETIADVMGDPAFRDYVRALWRREIIPVLAPPPGTDLEAYADALFERFSNPAIRHRTWQIAMDGSQKLPQRLLGTISENLKDGRPFPGLALAVAAWMRYAGGIDESGSTIDVRDPLAARLKDAAQGSGSPAETVDAFLAIREVFPPDLARQMAGPVRAAYEGLLANGARRSVAECHS